MTAKTPAPDASSASAFLSTPGPSSDPGRPPRDTVLVVDDHPIDRALSEAQFACLGYPVRTATHGQAAIAMCLESPPGVVLMDIEMPVLDGLETTSRLRALQAGGSLPFFPILAWTSDGAGAVRRRCASVGMDGVFTRPQDFDRIVSEVRRLLPDGTAPR